MTYKRKLWKDNKVVLSNKIYYSIDSLQLFSNKFKSRNKQLEIVLIWHCFEDKISLLCYNGSGKCNQNFEPVNLDSRPVSTAKFYSLISFLRTFIYMEKSLIRLIGRAIASYYKDIDKYLGIDTNLLKGSHHHRDQAWVITPIHLSSQSHICVFKIYNEIKSRLKLVRVLFPIPSFQWKR